MTCTVMGQCLSTAPQHSSRLAVVSPRDLGIFELLETHLTLGYTLASAFQHFAAFVCCSGKAFSAIHPYLLFTKASCSPKCCPFFSLFFFTCDLIHTNSFLF